MIPLRSLLFVPGSNERMLAKAATVEADGLILDLEDSVAPDRKGEARKLVREALGGLGGKYRVVRVNGFESDWTQADLEAVACPDLDAVMLPKAESAAQVRALEAHLTRFERDRGVGAGRIQIIPLLETARGVFRCYDILAASPRVTGANVGAAEDADLIRNLGGRWTPEGRSLLYARSKVLLEARAAGVAHILDGVYMRLDDEEGLRADALLARELGYTGKTAIHPRQVPILNEVFTPSAEEVAYYREMLAAYEAGEREGKGAVSFQGKMIDVAMAVHARRLIGLAEAIGKGPPPS